MDIKLSAILLLAVAATQVASQYVLPKIVPSGPLYPTLPPLVAVNPIVDAQAYTGLSCGCANIPPPCSCGATYYDGTIPTSVSTPCGCGTSPCSCGTSPCGCGTSPCGCGSSPCSCGTSPCSCGSPLVTVPYSSYQPCGCGLTTPLLPPLPPVVGCSKYLRQICTQPPFL